MSTEPRFIHDCDKCVFLGTHQQYDLYWCVNPSHRKLDSVLARYSDRPEDYISHHPPGCFAGPPRADEWYGLVLERAEKAGLYDPKTQGWSQTRRCCQCGHKWTVSFPYGKSGNEGHEACPECLSGRTYGVHGE